MQQRYALRYETYCQAASKGDLTQWDTSEWLTDVLHYDEASMKWSEGGQGDHGLTAAPEHTSGEVLEWTPDAPLPQPTSLSHFPVGRRKLAQRIIYPYLAPLLDQFQQGWPKGYVPSLRSSARAPKVD
jgi:hypothetical protein